MKKKEPRWHAARGITVPGYTDSAVASHFLASFRMTMREVSHGRA
jgi:hypothetical protein